MTETAANLGLGRISITTTRDYNLDFYSRYFPREVNYRGHISTVEFPHPVKDFSGDENKKITLKTAWFFWNSGRDPYWVQWLDDEDGYQLFGENFGELEGSFEDYSLSKLNKWQEEGLKRHTEVLAKLEELSCNADDTRIEKGFLERRL